MGAVAALAVIGSALLLISVVAAIVLCRKALQAGADFEAEIKAPSFSLRLRAGSGILNPDTPVARSPNGSLEAETPAKQASF
jgi:hypothetical protein